MDLQQVFYGLTTAVGLLLAVLTLQRLLSGWWRKYPILTFLLVLYVLSVVPPIASYMSNGNWTLISAQRLYWILAFLSQITVFFLVLQLMHRIGKELPERRPLLHIATVVALAAAAGSMALHFDHKMNTFMSFVTRDLTFIAAVLNMLLWRDLVKLRKRDLLLLTVCGGLGIQCAGEAAGHSIRMFGGRQMHEFGNAVMSLAAVLTLAVWHAGFSRAKLNPTRRQPVHPAATEPVSPAIDSKAEMANTPANEGNSF